MAQLKCHQPSGTPDFQALLQRYQRFQQQTQANEMGLSVAISAFWNTTATFGSTTEEVYKQIVDRNLNNVVVMGYRNFVGGSDCNGGGPGGLPGQRSYLRKRTASPRATLSQSV